VQVLLHHLGLRQLLSSQPLEVAAAAQVRLAALLMLEVLEVLVQVEH
jgi:hypothetical protein